MTVAPSYDTALDSELKSVSSDPNSSSYNLRMPSYAQLSALADSVVSAICSGTGKHSKQYSTEYEDQRSVCMFTYNLNPTCMYALFSIGIPNDHCEFYNQSCQNSFYMERKDAIYSNINQILANIMEIFDMFYSSYIRDPPTQRTHPTHPPGPP